MIAIEENILLAPHTTLGVGGVARFFALCTSEVDVKEALQYARAHELKIAVLGGGSNTLVPDEGCEGLVLKIAIPGMTFADDDETVLVTVGAGVSWDALVREAGERSVWGIENLAAIPGTVGGAAVQNIGAYGVELAKTFLWADAVLLANGGRKRVTREEAQFEYRTSIFKKQNTYLITHVALRLLRSGVPELAYPDLARAKSAGETLATPTHIADAVRRIRARKFPQNEGTAGSFFKNPIVNKTVADNLLAQFPALTTYPVNDGEIKISLAWILDNVLHLKGYREGGVRLFEQQPLVLVADLGTRAHDVETFTANIAKRVKEATGLTIEREVETLAAR